MADTAVVTSFFNFAGFKVPQRNLRRWKRYMDSLSIPNFGIELVLPGQEAVSADWKGWTQLQVVRELHMLFQKEAALNVLVNSLPSRFTKVIICDCDVFFANSAWYQQTSALLDHFKVVYPYSTAHWTDDSGKVFLSRASVGADPNGLWPKWRAHPGFCVGLTRDFWTTVNGLFPFYVVGSGDTALAVAALQKEPAHKVFTCSANLLSVYIEWYEEVGKWSQRKVAYTKGDLYHEHHGDRSKRMYGERLEWITRLDPRTHLKFTNEGLLEWTPEAPVEMVERVRDYFIARQEDE